MLISPDSLYNHPSTRTELSFSFCCFLVILIYFYIGYIEAVDFQMVHHLFLVEAGKIEDYADLRRETLDIGDTVLVGVNTERANGLAVVFNVAGDYFAAVVNADDCCCYHIIVAVNIVNILSLPRPRTVVAASQGAYALRPYLCARAVLDSGRGRRSLSFLTPLPPTHARSGAPPQFRRNFQRLIREFSALCL